MTAGDTENMTEAIAVVWFIMVRHPCFCQPTDLGISKGKVTVSRTLNFWDLGNIWIICVGTLENSQKYLGKVQPSSLGKSISN